MLPNALGTTRRPVALFIRGMDIDRNDAVKVAIDGSPKRGVIGQAEIPAKPDYGSALHKMSFLKRERPRECHTPGWKLRSARAALL